MQINHAFSCLLFGWVLIVSDVGLTQDNQFRRSPDMRDGFANQRQMPMGNQMNNQQGNQQGRDNIPQFVKQMMRDNPDAFQTYQQIKELEAEVKQLAMEYRSANASGRSAQTENSMRNILSETFRLKMELTEKQLLEFEQTLKELRKAHEERKHTEKVIIDQYMQTLLRNEPMPQR